MIHLISLFPPLQEILFYQSGRPDRRGVLTEKECDAVDFGSREDDVDYEKIYKGRYKLLRKAYERSDISKNPDFVRF